LVDTHEVIPNISRGVDNLVRGQNNQERQAILDWLTSTDSSLQQSDFIGRRQEGTGEWLLKSSGFQDWVNQKTQILFCPGIPGGGKTIITSIVVDHLCRRFQNDAKVGIAYLYCNFRQQEEQRPEDLLLSLLKQLAQRQPSIPESVKSLYKYHKMKETRPLFSEVSEVLHSVITGYQRTFIIIDALDECQVSNGYRYKFLSEIFKLQAKTGASLLATSRFIPDIEKEFEKRKSILLEIRARDEDVQRYLDNNMCRLPSFVLFNPGLQDEIKTEITTAVRGM